MNLPELAKRVVEIEEMSDDWVRSREAENYLYRDFINFVVNCPKGHGIEALKTKARIIATTQKLRFPR